MRFDPDAPVEDMDTTARLVLEGIQLHWGQLLTEEGWHGLAQQLQANTGQDFKNYAFYVSVRTMMLGLVDHRYRHTISWPATWRQHLKQALFIRLGRHAHAENWRWRFRNWVQRRLGPVEKEQETVEVQVYKSACPHIEAGPRHDAQLCIQYLSRLDQRGYRESDYLVSKARAALSEALRYGDLHHITHPVADAAENAKELLAQALEAMGREDR